MLLTRFTSAAVAPHSSWIFFRVTSATLAISESVPIESSIWPVCCSQVIRSTSLMPASVSSPLTALAKFWTGFSFGLSSFFFCGSAAESGLGC